MAGCTVSYRVSSEASIPGCKLTDVRERSRKGNLGSFGIDHQVDLSNYQQLLLIEFSVCTYVGVPVSLHGAAGDLQKVDIDVASLTQISVQPSKS